VPAFEREKAAMKSNAMDKPSLYYLVGRAICKNEFLDCIQALGAELEAILPDNDGGPTDGPEGDEEDEDEEGDDNDDGGQDDGGLGGVGQEEEDNEENDNPDTSKTQKIKINEDVITNIISTVVADKQYSWKELAEIAQVPRSTLHRMFGDCRRDTVYADGVSLVKFRGSDIIQYIREK